MSVELTNEKALAALAVWRTLWGRAVVEKMGAKRDGAQCTASWLTNPDDHPLSHLEIMHEACLAVLTDNGGAWPARDADSPRWFNLSGNKRGATADGPFDSYDAALLASVAACLGVPEPPEEVPEEFRTDDCDCGVRGPGGKYLCTRKAGHAGDHVAMLDAYPAPPVARWPQAAPAPAAPCPHCAEAEKAAHEQAERADALAESLAKADNTNRVRHEANRVAEQRLAAAQFENRALAESLASLNDRIAEAALLSKQRECNYCGKRMPNTYEATNAHMLTCPKHPMREVEAERDKLAKWKAEAMSVEATWDVQAVGVELGLTLGECVRQAILPGIKAIKAELATAESGRLEALDVLAEAQRRCRRMDEDNDKLILCVRQQASDILELRADVESYKAAAMIHPHGWTVKAGVGKAEPAKLDPAAEAAKEWFEQRNQGTLRESVALLESIIEKHFPAAGPEGKGNE